MKHWAMLAGGVILFIVGLALGITGGSTAWGSVLFIVGIVLLVMSLDKVGKPDFMHVGGKKSEDDPGSYQI